MPISTGVSGGGGSKSGGGIGTVVRGAVKDLGWADVPHQKGIDTGKIIIDRNNVVRFLGDTIADSYKSADNELRFSYKGTDFTASLIVDSSLNVTVDTTTVPPLTDVSILAVTVQGSGNTNETPVFIDHQGYIRWNGHRPDEKFRFQDTTTGSEDYPRIRETRNQSGFRFLWSATDIFGDQLLDTYAERQHFTRSYSGHHNLVTRLTQTAGDQFGIGNANVLVPPAEFPVENYFKVDDRLRIQDVMAPDSYFRVASIVNSPDNILICNYYDSSGNLEDSSPERPNHNADVTTGYRFDHLDIYDEGIGYGHHWQIYYGKAYDIESAEIWVPGDIIDDTNRGEFAIVAKSAGDVDTDLFLGDDWTFEGVSSGDLLKISDMIASVSRVKRATTTVTSFDKLYMENK